MLRVKSSTVYVACAMAVMTANAHADIHYTVTDLGLFAAGNDSGVIVGRGQDASDISHAVKFDGLGGVIDLNDLIDPLSGWQLEDVSGINNLGHIVGYGYYSVSTHAFLLTLIPEPSTGVLLAMGGLMLLRLRQR